MKKYIMIPRDTLTYAKYLSLKTGKFYDNSTNMETVTNVPQINSHILYANLGVEKQTDVFLGEKKNINHKKNEEYYRKIISETSFTPICNFSDKENQKIFDNHDNLIVIIPGIKYVKKVKTRTQYLIGNVEYENVKYDVVIQKSAYTEFIKYVKKMPGTVPQQINYVESYDFSNDETSPASRIQYLQNVYTESADVNLEASNIDDFYDSLNRKFKNTFLIDLFVSHQSLDKTPYVEEYVLSYRKSHPQSIVWFDKDFFKVGVKSNSNYARNTIAHGILNSVKISLIMSHNYFNKLLKNIDSDADYFGINYELAVIAKIKDKNEQKLNEVKIYQYEFEDDNIDLSKKIFNHPKYIEVEQMLMLRNLCYSDIDNIFADSVDVSKIKMKYIYLNF